MKPGPDYAAWSPAFNMHFGFFRWGLNPLDREVMLEQMNLEVLRRLDLDGRVLSRILDMGCGLGATLRSIARRVPAAEVHGITLVPWQFEQGNALNIALRHTNSIRLTLGDYEHTRYPSASFDAVCAIESSCYAAGANKSAFLREARRLLRPGGRVVVADGFLGSGKLRGLQKRIFRKLCECWVIDALGEIGPFTRRRTGSGSASGISRLKRIARRHVAPSVLHVPLVTLKFLLSEVLFGRRTMTRARWNNVLAPILLPLVGFPIGPLGYYIVRATRG